MLYDDGDPKFQEKSVAEYVLFRSQFLNDAKLSLIRV